MIEVPETGWGYVVWMSGLLGYRRRRTVWCKWWAVWVIEGVRSLRAGCFELGTLSSLWWCKADVWRPYIHVICTITQTFIKHPCRGLPLLDWIISQVLTLKQNYRDISVSNPLLVVSDAGCQESLLNSMTRPLTRNGNKVAECILCCAYRPQYSIWSYSTF